jgi:hypothetical protein
LLCRCCFFASATLKWSTFQLLLNMWYTNDSVFSAFQYLRNAAGKLRQSVTGTMAGKQPIALQGTEATETHQYTTTCNLGHVQRRIALCTCMCLPAAAPGFVGRWEVRYALACKPGAAAGRHVPPHPNLTFALLSYTYGTTVLNTLTTFM